METLFEIETWINLFNQYQELGILIPFLLAMMESFIPALPLIAIVTINISAHGFLIGFSTSFLGNIIGSLLVFTFFRGKYGQVGFKRRGIARKWREYDK